ncbi:hypothetical protein PSTT_14893 [Puccinia striiformis]|uniref:Uncharacterized protein n=1 Tax=Puccinia striiformis TaxID=27350 RepID=A0A2S4UKB7_9BASI|nr:hypothetical protein PSTT_14893 [Puccinia striiformis]
MFYKLLPRFHIASIVFQGGELC